MRTTTRSAESVGNRHLEPSWRARQIEKDLLFEMCESDSRKRGEVYARPKDCDMIRNSKSLNQLEAENYSEAEIQLPEGPLRRLEEVRKFQQSVVSSSRYLDEEINAAGAA